MFLPHDLITHLSFFLSLKEIWLLAQVCRSCYHALTNTATLRRLLREYDSSLQRKDLLRGLLKFGHSHFYRSVHKDISRITDIHEVYTYHTIDYSERFCYVDIFGRLIRSDQPIGPREEHELPRTCVVVKEVMLHLNTERKFDLVTLDHHGCITMNQKIFPVQAIKLISTRSGVIYLDHNNEYKFLASNGEITTPVMPPRVRQTWFNEKSETTKILTDYLTYEGDLYSTSPMTLVKQGIRKIIFWDISDNMHYLTYSGDLMFHGVESTRCYYDRKIVDKCLLSKVDDAMMSKRYPNVYALAHGTIHCFGPRFTHVVCQVDPGFTRIEVTQMDKDCDIIRVW